MKRRRKLWSILVVCSMVLGVVAAGLPMAVSGADATEPEVGVIHVDYDLQGGDWKDGEKIDPYDLPAPVGVHIDPSEFKGEGIIPVKDGLTFIGWHYIETDMDGNVVWDGEEDFWDFDKGTWIRFPEEPLETNLTLIAVWEPVEESEGIIHVSHDLDGGAWKSGEEIGDYDIEYTLGDIIPASEFKHESRTPEREGYTFVGWKYKFTDMDGTVFEEYDPWEYDMGWYSSVLDPVETNLLFTAKWEPDPNYVPETPGTVEKKEPTKAEPGKVMPKTPKTGDTSPLALATLLLVGAGAATIGMARKRHLDK